MSSARRIEVCLYWFHPMLLSEFQRRLGTGSFHLSTHRLEPYSVPDLRTLAYPEASLYVLESHPRRVVTEALAAGIARRFPGARVLAVAEKLPDQTAFPLLLLGVKGLLKYSELPDQLERAALVVAGGGFWVSRSLLSAFLDSVRSGPLPAREMSGTDNLTRREREVLECLLQNLLNKEIAKRLHISERTAKFHVSNLLAKFGVQRRGDLMLLRLTQPGIGSGAPSAG